MTKHVVSYRYLIPKKQGGWMVFPKVYNSYVTDDEFERMSKFKKPSFVCKTRQSADEPMKEMLAQAVGFSEVPDDDAQYKDLQLAKLQKLSKTQVGVVNRFEKYLARRAKEAKDADK